MHRRIAAIALCTALVTVAACAGTAPTAPTGAPPEAARASGTLITGQVLAPAGVIAAGGANVIAAGGANVIAAGGANVIAAGGANFSATRRTLSVTESPLVGAEVFLADPAGNPYPMLPHAVTDAQGRYTLPNVPPGATFLVMARIKTQEGKDAALQTLTKTSDFGATADLRLHTTLVTAAVIAADADVLGHFNPVTFKEAVDATVKHLKDGELPDLADRKAILSHMAVLAEKEAALKQAVDKLQQELTQLQHSAEELQAKIAATVNGSPLPVLASALPAVLPSSDAVTDPLTGRLMASPAASGEPTKTPTMTASLSPTVIKSLSPTITATLTPKITASEAPTATTSTAPIATKSFAPITTATLSPTIIKATPTPTPLVIRTTTPIVMSSPLRRL